MFNIGLILRKIFQCGIFIWIFHILDIIRAMYTTLLVTNNMTFDIIDDNECIISLKGFERKFPYYRYPKDLIVTDEGLDTIYWVGDDWNYVINLPKKLGSGEKVYVAKIKNENPDTVVFEESDGHIDWKKHFENLTTYTFHDDID